MRIDPEQVNYFKQFDRPTFYSAWWTERLHNLDGLIGQELDLMTFRQEPAISDGGLDTHDPIFSKLPDDMLLRLAHSAPVSFYHEAVEMKTVTQHLAHFVTAGYPRSFGPIIEWGAGYGNMARMSRLFPEPHSHYRVDAPAMLGLQEAFLQEVHAFGSCSIPLAQTESLGDKDIDTFFGLFSVDESSRECQDYLFEKNWFGAANVVIAMYPDKSIFPEAKGLRGRLEDDGFIETPCLSPESVYMIRSNNG